MLTCPCIHSDFCLCFDPFLHDDQYREVIQHLRIPTPHIPNITLASCPELAVDSCDIVSFFVQRFSLRKEIRTTRNTTPYSPSLNLRIATSETSWHQISIPCLPRRALQPPHLVSHPQLPVDERRSSFKWLHLHCHRLPRQPLHRPHKLNSIIIPNLNLSNPLHNTHLLLPTPQL